MNTVQTILIYLPTTSHINTVYLTHLMSWYWYVMKSILYSNFLSLLFFKLKFLFSISVEQITFNHPVSLASSASLSVSVFPCFSRAWQFWGVSVCSRAQSCPTLSDPTGCSPPGSSFCGIFKARTLEEAAVFFSRVSFWSRDGSHISCVSCIGR